MLSVEPKLVRIDRDDPESEMVQGCDDQGNLRWTVTIAVPVRGYARERFENLSTTVASPTPPCANMPPGVALVPDALEMGTMKSDKTSYTQYFSASAIRHVQMQPQTGPQHQSKE
jgi:hypothetical protein